MYSRSSASYIFTVLRFSSRVTYNCWHANHSTTTDCYYAVPTVYLIHPGFFSVSLKLLNKENSSRLCIMPLGNKLQTTRGNPCVRRVPTPPHLSLRPHSSSPFHHNRSLTPPTHPPITNMWKVYSQLLPETTNILSFSKLKIKIKYWLQDMELYLIQDFFLGKWSWC